MCRGQIKLFIFLTFIQTNFYTQTKTGVEFSGNYFFNKDEIQIHIAPILSLSDNQGKRDSIIKRVAQLYYDNGFFDCSVSSDTVPLTDSSDHSIKFQVIEGERYEVTQINIPELDSFLTSDYEKLQRQVVDAYYNSSLVLKSVGELIKVYENKGYPFVKVIIESVVKDSQNTNSLAVNLKIDKGDQIKVNRIEIRGNTNTADYVILREIDVKEGDLFSEDKISRIPVQLNRLKFFDPVPMPEFYLNSKKEGILEIKLTERRVNNFDGIIGYIPPARDEKSGYFTGLVTISMKNLFGTGRGTLLRWQKIDRLSSEIEFNYSEPRIFNLRLNAGGGLFQKKQDSIFVQQKIDLFAEFPATSEIFFILQFSRENIIPSILEVPVFTVYNSIQNTISAGLRIDTRDDPFSPTEGVLFQTSFGNSEKKIRGPEEFIAPDLPLKYSIKRITMNLSLFYSFFSRQVVMFSVNGKNIEGGKVEVSDMYKLGGTRSLRGYREHQFFGSLTAWTNMEYRFLLTRRSYAFLFFDTGYYKRKEDKQLKITGAEETKIGYGFGLNLETGVGTLNVSYALAKGDEMNEGKIHFGIINDF